MRPSSAYPTTRSGLIALVLSLTLAVAPFPPRWLLFGTAVTHAAPLTPPLAPSPLVQPSGAPPEVIASVQQALASAQGHRPAAASLSLASPVLPVIPHTAAAQQPSPTPALSVVRRQSTSLASAAIQHTLIVTFTVTNHRPPALAPTIPANASLTDTLTILAQTTPQQDPNTIHNVLLVDALLPPGSFLAGQPAPDRSPTELAWNLGSIPPLGTVTAILTLRVAPTPVSTPITLDRGATVWGTLGGTPISAQATPITLLPDSVGGQPLAPWLAPTLEANPDDPYVLRHIGLVGATPSALFGAVQALGYEAYTGSLRGARGTLWSRAGNSLDQSSLLIAMLRSQGTPARYRHGTLSRERAQELIRAMFPTTGAVVGYVPPDAPKSDPVNDPTLLAEASDHWWVEALLDGAWVALDPTFSYATPGQTFAAPEGPPLAAPPDDLRHTVTLSLEQELYQVIDYLHTGFQYTTTLEYTYTTAALVGEPLTLEHFVARARPPGGCLFFCWTRYTYTPYFRLGDSPVIVAGHANWELLNDYPFGQRAITAEWLHIDHRDAQGEVTRHTRTIADRVGAGPRTGQLRGPKMIPGLLTADVIQQFGPGSPSLVHELDSHTISFNPSWMDARYAAHQAEQAFAIANQVVALPPPEALTDPNITIREQARRTIAQVGATTTKALDRLAAISYVGFSDVAARQLASTGLVRAYPDTPRITIASTIISQTHPASQTGELRGIIDLLHDSVRAIAYPGQAQGAEGVYHLTRGINNTFLETQVGDTLNGPGLGAATILKAAQEQGIPLIYVDNQSLDRLAPLTISTQAKAFILDAVQQGHAVFVPERMVGVRGIPTIAWWQVNLETGETIGVGEDGTHQHLVIFAPLFVVLIIILQIAILFQRLSTWQGAATATWLFFWLNLFTASGEIERQQQPPTQIYADVLRNTKNYMNEAVWPEFRRLCDIEYYEYQCDFLK